MALGRGYALPFIAGKQGSGGAGGAYGLLWQEAINANVPPLTAEDFDAGQGSCLFTRGKSLYDAVETKPSLLIVPQMRGSGKLAVDIPSPVFFDVTRATTATRVNSSGLIESVASGVPRLDWYATPATQDLPATGCPALLVEPSGTNLVRQSENFGTTWTAVNSTQLSTNVTATLDPAGSNTADLIFCQASGSVAQGFSQTITAAPSGTYTMSVFLKKAVNFDFFRLQFTDGANVSYQAYYNIANGTVGTIPSGSTATITHYGNGWYRVTHSRSTASGNVIMGLRLASADNQANVAADGSSGSYAWGAQLEAGTVATTYIPTTTAAVTRNADLVNASGSTISGLIGQTQGTIYAEVIVSKLLGSVQRSIVNIGNSTSNRIFLGYTGLESNKIRFLVSDSDGDRADFRISAAATGVLKIAARYSSADSNLYVNGVAASETADLSFSLSALQHLHIGHNLDDLLQFNDTIRAVALYESALTNDDLQTLTT